ncbi:MAG: peptidoglycan L-alanyl-D-glutamate endopeptidase CwlK [Cognaticolwellia sp.]|jgi:peptidoglycan L-alanyl-D-glutamate endopeptidase CwlK
MPKFGKTSSGRLATCHIDLQLIFNTVIKTVDCSVFCGHRGKASQDKAFDDNVSELKYPHSKHNTFPSLAVDAGPYFPDIKNTDWSDRQAFAVFAGYCMRVADELLEKGLIAHRLRWGGDWDGDGRTLDQTFHDLPHFELVKAL